MTDNEMRIAAAYTCGWKHTSQEVWKTGGPHFLVGGIGEQSKKWFDYLPDYPNDLNAMHEAEKTLTEKQQVWYMQKLTQVRFKQGVGGMVACMIDKTTFATARQRCEAFLRTVGKWKD